MFSINEFTKAVDREEFVYAKEMLIKESDVNTTNEFHKPALQLTEACINLDRRAESYKNETLGLKGQIEALEMVVERFIDK